MTHRITAALALVLLAATPAMAQDVFRPTRYLGPNRMPTPGIEEAQVLETGAFLGSLKYDVANIPTAGLYWGALPNLEVGAQIEVRGGVASNSFPGGANLGVYGKYNLFSSKKLALALFARGDYRQSFESSLGSSGSGIFGFPVSYSPWEFISFDLMPLTVLGSSLISDPPGIAYGTKIRVLPSLWVQLGDYVGGSFATDTASFGLRFEASRSLIFDVNLGSYLANTGSPGYQTGTIGITSYFGGSPTK